MNFREQNFLLKQEVDRWLNLDSLPTPIYQKQQKGFHTFICIRKMMTVYEPRHSECHLMQGGKTIINLLCKRIFRKITYISIYKDLAEIYNHLPILIF